MTYQPTYDPRGYLPLDARWLPVIMERNPGEAQQICDTYDDCCAIIGYDANAAIAQGCVETSFFTSPRWVNSHNAAGIGIYADDTPDVIWGEPPHGDVQTGIQAQCDLLTDYYGDGSEPFGTLEPLGFGGMVLGYDQLCDMDGVWAADLGYSEEITGVMNDVIPQGGGEMEGTYGEDLIAMLETQIGHPYSGDYDSRNGNHPWAYWCEAGVESTGRNCGIDVIAQASATAAGEYYADVGLLDQSDPQHGDVLVFGPDFYWPDGHTGVWNADKGLLLGTLTDGSGVGYTAWGPWTGGYMGRYTMPGVVGPKRGVDPAPPMVANIRQPDNPFETDDVPEIIIGGGFMRFYKGIAAGQDPMTVVGFARANEAQATVTDEDGTSQQRTIQRFERATLIYQPENPFPYDIVAALATQTIAEM